jgi:hypothetical protein
LWCRKIVVRDPRFDPEMRDRSLPVELRLRSFLGREEARLATAAPLIAGAGESPVPHPITTASASILTRTAP